MNWGTFPDPTERRVWIFLLATLFLGLNYLLRTSKSAAGGDSRLVLGKPGHPLSLLAICRERGRIYLVVSGGGSLCDLALSPARP